MVSSTLGTNASARSSGSGVKFRARHNGGGGDGSKKVDSHAIAAAGSFGVGISGARALGVDSATISATGNTELESVASAGASGFLTVNNGHSVGYASGGAGGLLGGGAVMTSTMEAKG